MIRNVQTAATFAAILAASALTVAFALVYIAVFHDVPTAGDCYPDDPYAGAATATFALAVILGIGTIFLFTWLDVLKRPRPAPSDDADRQEGGW